LAFGKRERRAFAVDAFSHGKLSLSHRGGCGGSAELEVAAVNV